MGSTCTAVMCARTSEEGKVSVTVHPFHYGHATDKTDLPYIRLPKTVRDFAQEKLLKGEPASRVINDIRKSLEETGDPATRRGFWIGRRDLRNMCNSLKIRPQTETSTQKERVEMSSEELDNKEIRPPKEVDDLWQERKKLWRGPSARLSEIRQRHAAAAELVAARTAAAHRLSDAARPTWLVGPFAETDHQYIRIEQHHRLCPFGCQLRCEDCGVCAHQFTCQCQDWVSHKLPCRHMHYLCMVVEDLLGPLPPPDQEQDNVPGVAEIDDTPGVAETVDSPCVSPARELPPVTPSAGRPEEGAARRQQVVTKMQGALSAIERLPDTLAEESYQRILAHLAVLERLVALEVRPQTPVQELLPPTENGQQTSNAKSDPHPTPSSKRRQRTVRSRGRSRAKSSTAQRGAVNLVASDVDLENLLVVQQDHCY
ncbi:uncharacterized protein LOC122387405 [Amphibalanus amphitrite]|uniref:uncharacterized protein LOC122387405 n=1 Tax=Amphibalanus amphitrite TaxID=1232801 RepID=UPI001C925B5D|nr:uncharacterized protein LOC122387405 [Amphibalanus amphitrite]XP_043233506.1 uncharacterized protein LOC122387405 [Amphibalanus amphitrite]